MVSCWSCRRGVLSKRRLIRIEFPQSESFSFIELSSDSERNHGADKSRVNFEDAQENNCSVSS